ncbi:MAG: hypothetical protein M1814_002211 [Vezdaea aestivalis]|nr:MAG: hypothetical protein M1814_002211 [Vezdaea aestivalis]
MVNTSASKTGEDMEIAGSVRSAKTRGLSALATGVSNQPLTPPLTPGDISFPKAGEKDEASLQALWKASHHPRLVPNTLSYDVCRPDQPSEYGRGAWSVVRPATIIRVPSNQFPDTLTPPSGSFSSEKLVAVKSPLHYEAVEVIAHEARILTYLQTTSLQSQTRASRFVVDFLGYNDTTKSLALESLPLTLLDFSNSSLAVCKRTLSTATMFSPVVGDSQWLHFAKRLVQGLNFLHTHNIIHGDIKPQNILLRRQQYNGSDPFVDQEQSSSTLFDPVFCDFSSSHFLQTGVQGPLISAVTTTFTAPELLNAMSHHHTGPPAVADTFSDIYSLGVTLITPAIGTGVYDQMSNNIQRMSCAREGRAIDFARGGDQASRIMKRSLVSKALISATSKKPCDRPSVGEWLESLCVLEKEAC